MLCYHYNGDMRNKDLQDLNLNFYNRYGYDFSKTRSNLWDGMKKIKEIVNDDDFVLDIGCGNGRIAPLFNKDKYIGIDFSSSLLNDARIKNKEYIFIEKDILKPLWFTDLDKFDVVLLIAIIHHIPSIKKRIQFFKDIKKNIK